MVLCLVFASRLASLDACLVPCGMEAEPRAPAPAPALHSALSVSSATAADPDNGFGLSPLHLSPRPDFGNIFAKLQYTRPSVRSALDYAAVVCYAIHHAVL